MVVVTIAHRGRRGGQPRSDDASPSSAPPRALLLERSDDANALEIVEARQVLGVDNLDAGVDAGGENHRIPEGSSAREVKLFRPDEDGLGSPLHGTVRGALRQREPALSASPCLIEHESIAAERLHGADRSCAASREDARKGRRASEGRT